MSANNNKKTNSILKTVLTKETFGLVLIIFSILCFICLVTKDLVFFTLGKNVSNFLLGVFGYSAYILNVLICFMGFVMLTDKKISLKSKGAKYAITFFILTIALLHAIKTAPYASLSYGEYLSQCYNLGSAEISAVTSGGLLLGLIMYGAFSILTSVGTYVLIAIALISVLCLFVHGVLPKNNNFRIKQKTLGMKVGDKIISGYKEYPVPNVSFPNYNENEESLQGLFVRNNDFELKTKRDKELIKMKLIQTHEGGMIRAETNLTYNQNKVDSQKYVTSIKTTKQVKPLQKEEPKISADDILQSKYQSNYKANLSERLERINKIQPEISNNNLDTPEARSQNFVDKYCNLPEDDARPVDFENTTINDVFEREKEPKFDSIPLTPNESVFNDKDTIVEEEQILPKESNIFSASRRTERNIVNSNIFENNGNETKFDNVVEEPKLVEEKKEEVKPTLTREFSAPSPTLFDKSFETEKEELEIENQYVNYNYKKPPINLLPLATNSAPDNSNIAEVGRKIEECFAEYGINDVKVTSFLRGPSVTRYELQVPHGVRSIELVRCEAELKRKLQLPAGDVRLETIPGSDKMGLEVPNDKRDVVSLREIIESDRFANIKPYDSIAYAIGKDIVGGAIVEDLSKAPHTLIAGTTGAGKSVCLNSMLVSLLYKYSPEDLRFILVDPKFVEFKDYQGIPHLLTKKILNSGKEALVALTWLVEEMDRRYQLFARHRGVSKIADYNERVASKTNHKMPYIVIVLDEYADLVSELQREIEAKLQRIAQKARAAGIHIVVATQKPIKEVITTTIKSNIQGRIAFKVLNRTDSSLILDAIGAEKLLGKGDMLVKHDNELVRYQGCLVDPSDICNVIDYIVENNESYYNEELDKLLNDSYKEEADSSTSLNANASMFRSQISGEQDAYFKDALRYCIKRRVASAASIVASFGVGTTRANKIIMAMEKLGYIAPLSGTANPKGREVYMTREQYEEKYGSFDD